METKLVKREPYFDFLKETIDDKHIKIITGVRRSGKSILLEMLAKDLIDYGISPDQIIRINFEIFKYSEWFVNDLYYFIKERAQAVMEKNFISFWMKFS